MVNEVSLDLSDSCGKGHSAHYKVNVLENVQLLVEAEVLFTQEFTAEHLVPNVVRYRLEDLVGVLVLGDNLATVEKMIMLAPDHRNEGRLTVVIDIVIGQGNIKLVCNGEIIEGLKKIRLVEIVGIKEDHVLSPCARQALVSRDRGACVILRYDPDSRISLLVLLDYIKRVVGRAVINADYLYLL